MCVFMIRSFARHDLQTLQPWFLNWRLTCFEKELFICHWVKKRGDGGNPQKRRFPQKMMHGELLLTELALPLPSQNCWLWKSSKRPSPQKMLYHERLPIILVFHPHKTSNNNKKLVEEILYNFEDNFYRNYFTVICYPQHYFLPLAWEGTLVWGSPMG